ncbi:MAG TPA: hypothetical protein DHU78_07525, partial [Opitutae bacterium]|nr:hypothetical protein [Opitutae bacterium]
MNRSTIWRLGITLFLVLVSISLVSPLDDRNLADYASGQVTSEANASNHIGHETFAEVIETI